MSRFCDDYCEEWWPNQGLLWQANLQRALGGKRGQAALREMKEALQALPKKRIIAGAMCTVDVEKRKTEKSADPHGWYASDLECLVRDEGEGVCALGAFLWYKKVKEGADPQSAFDELPTLLGTEGEGDLRTAELGRDAGLTFTLAWHLAYRNDQDYEGMTPEERYESFMDWLDKQLVP